MINYIIIAPITRCLNKAIKSFSPPSSLTLSFQPKNILTDLPLFSKLTRKLFLSTAPKPDGFYVLESFGRYLSLYLVFGFHLFCDSDTTLCSPVITQPPCPDPECLYPTYHQGQHSSWISSEGLGPGLEKQRVRAGSRDHLGE